MKARLIVEVAGPHVRVSVVGDLLGQPQVFYVADLDPEDAAASGLDLTLAARALQALDRAAGTGQPS